METVHVSTAGSGKPVLIAAVRMLAGKRLTKAQLRKKLRDRGFAPDAVREAVEECERRKYLDDRTFAQLFVANVLEKKSVGPLRLMRDLIKQGIDPDLAREIVGQTENTHDERLERAIVKLEASRPGERADRLARRLVTQGFTAGAIARALRQRAARGPVLEEFEELK